MRSWRRSAAYRIAFANFAAYAIGIAMLGAVVFGVIHVAFTRQLDAMVSEDAQAIAEEFRSGGLGESTKPSRTRGGVQSDALRGVHAGWPPHLGSLQDGAAGVGRAR